MGDAICLLFNIVCAPARFARFVSAHHLHISKSSVQTGRLEHPVDPQQESRMISRHHAGRHVGRLLMQLLAPLLLSACVTALEPSDDVSSDEPAREAPTNIIFILTAFFFSRIRIRIFFRRIRIFFPAGSGSVEKKCRILIPE